MEVVVSAFLAFYSTVLQSFRFLLHLLSFVPSCHMMVLILISCGEASCMLCLHQYDERYNQPMQRLSVEHHVSSTHANHVQHGPQSEKSSQR